MASKTKQGYVITRSKSLAEYYTSSAAYDRPQWVALDEATVYASPDVAQQAVKKLWVNGSFAAKVQNLSELIDIDLEMPAKEEPALDDLGADEADPEMVAAKQSDDPEGDVQGMCPECDCDPCECDPAAQADGSPTVGLPTDEELPPTDELGPDVEHEEDSMLAQHLKAATGMESEETARLHPEEIKMFGRKRMDMKECKVGDVVIPSMGPHKGTKHKVIHVFDDGSMNIKPVGLKADQIRYKLGAVKAKPDQVKMVNEGPVKPTRMPPLEEETKVKLPARPGNDPAKPSENDTTAATMKEPKAKEIDLKDPVGTEDKPQTDLHYAVAHEHEDKVTVPAEIKSQLKAVIDDFAKAAKENDLRDDTKGSFAMTAGAALQQLLDDLELGTVAGIKQAQIHMTSYMNPITSHIPEEVTKFIARGGRKSSLKDLFQVKWDNVRGAK
jgi:hypothetical protein